MLMQEVSRTNGNQAHRRGWRGGSGLQRIARLHERRESRKACRRHEGVEACLVRELRARGACVAREAGRMRHLGRDQPVWHGR